MVLIIFIIRNKYFSVPETNPEDSDEERDVMGYSRCVRCICYYGNKIYWGDDGTNLKMLEWNEGNEYMNECMHLSVFEGLLL